MAEAGDKRENVQQSPARLGGIPAALQLLDACLGSLRRAHTHAVDDPYNQQDECGHKGYPDECMCDPAMMSEAEDRPLDAREDVEIGRFSRKGHGKRCEC